MEEKKSQFILPIKFPLLLAQGAEGIAVGLSTTKILPHNFNELLSSSIQHLKEKKFRFILIFKQEESLIFKIIMMGKEGEKFE